MRPIFHDYEYFEPAFHEILSGIEEMAKQKLYYLANRKWIFKGWVTHPNYNDVRFKLTYEDKETEEHYCISGYCDISKEFINVSEVAIEFDVIEERTKKEVYFKTDIDERRSLDVIEKAMNRLLKDNRSYKYFCEDYERYVKHDPIQYIKGLLANHLLDMEEEVFDEGFGATYHYTGEFGEDWLEIVVDDMEIDDEDVDVFDFINVNVCDRFHFNYSMPYSKEIRSLLPLLKETTIPINDFLIRTNGMHCINKEHHLQRIKARVCVDNGNCIKEVAVEAMYCAECNQYFISEVEFEKLCRKGRICSRVITLMEYKKITEAGFHSWAEKSLLRSYGYTVNAQDNLTDIERHRILSFVVENGIMKVEEIVYFIEWLINRNTGKDFYNARLKWNRDIDYIRNYKPIAGVVKVRDIYRKRYVTK